MAFLFNSNDINFQAANPFIAFGGKYNVTIEKAEHKGLTKSGMEMFTVWFKVEDTDAKGATVIHTFMDDSQATNYTPFRYREIGALLAQTGKLQDGQSVELNDVVNGLAGIKMNLTIKEFEKDEYTDTKTGAKKVAYRPRIAGIEPFILSGSEIDTNNPKPQVEKSAPQGQVRQQGGFGGGFDNAPIPPEPQSDAFGGGF